MSRQVTVVDYGVGNLFSVQRALESCGVSDVLVSARAEDIARADRLILPGVGAFRDGMRGLRDRNLVEPIVDYARSGRPLLGICLGMQMLARESEEFGRHEGLDLIPGQVRAIPRLDADGKRLKVPFIGWTPITLASPSAAAGSCLAGLGAGDAVYLVHSFHFVPDDPAHMLATYRFGAGDVTAAVRRDNITGFQFHPEKSGKVGLDILRTFVATDTAAAAAWR
ncbi:MAG: imidazole glycerol phosphate synthase subunit HisH [Caldimonas sp.]